MHNLADQFILILFIFIGSSFPPAHSWCKEKVFNQLSSWTENGNAETTNPLHCPLSDGNPFCIVEMGLTQSYTKTISHTVGASVSSGEIWAGVKLSYQHTFSTSLADATARSQTLTCKINPGWKVQLVLIPKFGVIYTEVKQYCCRTIYFVGCENGAWRCSTCGDNVSYVTTQVPLKNTDGSIQGDYFCRPELDS